MKLDEQADFPKLILSYEHHQKIMAYAQVCNTEVTGFFDVEFDKEQKAFVVTKVYDLLEQTASSADVEIDEEKVSDFNLQLIKQGAEHLPRGWWHSHCNMQPFLSATDDGTIELLKNDSFIIALVVNKSQKMFAAVKMFEPFEMQVDELDIEITFEDSKMLRRATREVKKKLIEPKATEYEYPGYQTKILYPGGRTKKFSKWLPKDKQRALDKIDELDLEKLWDKDSQAWIYVDKISGEIWEDYWEVLSSEDWGEREYAGANEPEPY